MMIRFLLVLLFLTAAFPVISFAQTKTITNSDLEKFRRDRLAAERDLRENYEALGFPSPEELEKLNEESRLERARWAENYRNQRLERERIRAASQPSQIVYYIPQTGGRTYGGYFLIGYLPVYFYGNRYLRHSPRNQIREPGFITNPIIRSNWLRQSAPMRNTYRGNFRNLNQTIIRRHNRRN